ncbi:MAG: DNA repair protein RecO [Muribaculaceae bacterium]|nr:DNA repair protein RecO [Muribaculaceae bacterium]
MAEKIRGIVLNVRKYNDKNYIVTLYTRERGRISFISPTGNGKASNMRRARLQPLAVLDTEVNFKAGAELQRLGSIIPAEIWSDLYFHPAKRALALFISEFLYRLLNDTMPDARLFDFLVDSFRLLDRLDKGISDFHIPFLVSLLAFSGIQPDVSACRPGYVFEIASGSFVPEFEAKGPVIQGEEAKAVPFISRLNFSNMKRLRLTSANRRQILYSILNYYSYHFPGLGSLKSPDVLREVFDQ